MKKIYIFFLLLLLPLSCFNGLSDMYDDLTMKVPICVDGIHGNDANEGRGWGNAVKTIQRAVEVAEEGDEIWVTEGNYIVSDLPGPYEDVITINKSLSVYGGFSGDESRKSQRNSDPENTKIAPSGATGLISISSAVNITIDGFSISGGYSAQPNVSVNSSAGIVFKNNIFTSYNTRISNSDVIFNNCEFINNTGSVDGDGGAIYSSASNIEIIDTSFTGNHIGTGQNGGAIYCTSGGSLKITDSRFEINQASGGNGGAIYCTGSEARISGTVFNGNTTRYGGAINSDAANIRITDCAFNANISSSGGAGFGGAIRSHNGSSMEISGSTFTNNVSISYGGGIDSDNSGLIILNSVFSGNTAESPGGAIRITGEDGLDSSIIIINTLFSNNLCNAANFYGGGIYCVSDSDSPDLFILNCTFYNNTANLPTTCGCFYMMDPNITSHIYNSLFYDNNGSYSIQGGNASCYNCAWDNGENCTGDPVNTQVLTSSPFVSTIYGNASFLRLVSGSACIDSGTNTVSGFTLPSTDLAENPRIVGGTVDIGCYEKQ